MMKEVYFKVKRCLQRGRDSYWEEFVIPYRSEMTVVTALREIQKNPVNARGQKTTPVVWECSCLEEVCGACSMIINGRARQACSAFVARLEQPILLEPLSKFPLVRDLKVDRLEMSQNLRRVKSWIPVDGTHDVGPGPHQSVRHQQRVYQLSRCTHCGCCLEACPQVNPHNDFVGAYVISQVRWLNRLPSGALNAEDRVDALMASGGLSECSQAQNCVKVCPKGLPLAESIIEMQKSATLRLFKRSLGIS